MERSRVTGIPLMTLVKRQITAAERRVGNTNIEMNKNLGNEDEGSKDRITLRVRPSILNALHALVADKRTGRPGMAPSVNALVTEYIYRGLETDELLLQTNNLFVLDIISERALYTTKSRAEARRRTINNVWSLVDQWRRSEDVLEREEIEESIKGMSTTSDSVVKSELDKALKEMGW